MRRGSQTAKPGAGRSRRALRLLLLLLVLPAPVTAARAGEAIVAVAANFAGAMQRLSPGFDRATGHRVRVSIGASGSLYAQIRNGAPFDALLSADAAIPKKLVQEGRAVPSTRFTYAIGRLVLWTPEPDRIQDGPAVLRAAEFGRLAVANPRTAPYGMAAEEVLRRLGLWERLAPRLVRGENVAQTFQFIASGNVPLGFVALAQVRALPPERAGSYWLVPPDLHDPLHQDAVLLKNPGTGRDAARAFLAYLRSPGARRVIEALGYALPE